MNTVENIFPNIKKQLFHSSERAFIASLRRQSDLICRGNIPEGYIRKAFNEFKNGYAYYYPDQNDPIGFCLWKLKQSQSVTKSNISPYTYMYIYLICAKPTNFKLARIMLHDAELFCQEKNIEYIQLQPANQKLQEHYELYGYLLTDSMNIIMTKNVKPIRLQRLSTTRRKHISKNSTNYTISEESKI